MKLALALQFSKHGLTRRHVDYDYTLVVHRTEHGLRLFGLIKQEIRIDRLFKGIDELTELVPLEGWDPIHDLDDGIRSAADDALTYADLIATSPPVNIVNMTPAKFLLKVWLSEHFLSAYGHRTAFESMVSNFTDNDLWSDIITGFEKSPDMDNILIVKLQEEITPAHRVWLEDQRYIIGYKTAEVEAQQVYTKVSLNIFLSHGSPFNSLLQDFKDSPTWGKVLRTEPNTGRKFVTIVLEEEGGMLSDEQVAWLDRSEFISSWESTPLL